MWSPDRHPRLRGIRLPGRAWLREIVAAEDLVALRAAFEDCIGSEKNSDDTAAGTRHIERLDLSFEAFDRDHTEASVLAAVHHVLQRPFLFLALGGRDPLPGYGQHGLHTDWMPRQVKDPYAVATAIWLLDGFDPDNGATRLVPGSHRVPGPVAKAIAEPESGHPDQQTIVAPAGSVLVLNGHVWQSGTRNRSQAPRRVLQAQFVTRDSAPPGEPIELPTRFGPAARALWGSVGVGVPGRFLPHAVTCTVTAGAWSRVRGAARAPKRSRS